MIDRLKARKQGEQSRSRDMIQHILEAATRVLEKTGYDKATTNRIAEKAGISIGSFYQYFPNKDALFSQIVQHQMTAKTKELEKLLHENASGTIEELVHVSLTYLLSAFYKNEKIARFLFRRLDQLNKSDLQIQMRRNFAQVLATHLSARGVESEVANTRALIVVNAVMGAIYGNLAQDDFALKLPDLQKELEQLTIRYLTS